MDALLDFTFETLLTNYILQYHGNEDERWHNAAS